MYYYLSNNTPIDTDAVIDGMIDLSSTEYFFDIKTGDVVEVIWCRKTEQSGQILFDSQGTPLTYGENHEGIHTNDG